MSHKRWQLSWIIFWSIISHNSLADALPVPLPEFATVCVGAAHPKFHVIFLQGITAEPHPTTGWLGPWTSDFAAKDFADHQLTPDMNNETLLDKVGKELDIQFAIPYSDVHCKGSAINYCWGTDDPHDVAMIYAKALNSAASCFALGDTPWGLLGFSNGGYHVGRVITQGHTPRPKWAVAIGSAGTTKNIEVQRKIKCPPFYLAIGTHDITRAKARKFYLELKKAACQVHYSEFPGGHVLTEENLRSILQKVL